MKAKKTRNTTQPQPAITAKPETTIWVTHSFIGFHEWPQAPEHRAYLRSRHRHKFNVRAEVTVMADNRELEFHNVLANVEEVCRNLAKDMREGSHKAASCEMLAAKILRYISLLYGPKRNYRVTVDEDGECGATITQLATEI